MVETIVVKAGADVEVAVVEPVAPLLDAWTVEEGWPGCCCACARQHCRASRPKPCVKLERSLMSMMLVVDTMAVAVRLCSCCLVDWIRSVSHDRRLAARGSGDGKRESVEAKIHRNVGRRASLDTATVPNAYLGCPACDSLLRCVWQPRSREIVVAGQDEQRSSRRASQAAKWRAWRERA